MNVKMLLTAAAIAVLPAAALPVTAWAHHGWAGQEDKVTVLEGAISGVSYTMPHGTISIIAADNTKWTVTLAPIGRMSSRGLTADKLKIGDKVKVEGNRNIDKSRNELKAAKITVNGVTTNLMA